MKAAVSLLIILVISCSNAGEEPNITSSPHSKQQLSWKYWILDQYKECLRHRNDEILFNIVFHLKPQEEDKKNSCMYSQKIVAEIKPRTVTFQLK
jgi:hypothetical protein